jgi:hypothetical protein
MSGGTILLLFVGVSTLAMFVGMLYGDYQSTGKWPWTKEKKGVNSGAKFG